MATRIVIVSWEGEVGGMMVPSKNLKNQEQSVGRVDIDGGKPVADIDKHSWNWEKVVCEAIEIRKL